MPPQERAARGSARRSYGQFCAAARALDAVGDRWSLLVVRELLAGPRRYTDLHADLPGVSTDMLASRLKDLEREGVVERRRLGPPVTAYVYELTPRGRELLPVLTALGRWGAGALGELRPTDAVRAHWFALPLLAALEPVAGEGVLDVVLEEGRFHLRLGGDGAESSYGDGAAPEATAELTLDGDACAELAAGRLELGAAVRDGRVGVRGEGELAARLRAAGGVRV